MTLRDDFERLRALRRKTPEEERRARRMDEILGELLFVGLALAMPFSYLISGVLTMMRTSPLEWTITIVIALALLWGGIRLLIRKRESPGGGNDAVRREAVVCRAAHDGSTEERAQRALQRCRAR
jgi:hypothetical protein